MDSLKKRKPILAFLFVLGDNRNNSQDSRFWGFVDIRKVKGKALYLYWAKDKSRIAMELK